MASASLYGVLHYLRRLGDVGPPAVAGDADLLHRFAAGRDGDAFAELVSRHGPLVWGVCARMLRDGPDAEDAFQATFLVLARKAGAVRRPELLGNWLYGVARRVASKARAAAARRRAEEKGAPEDHAVDPTPDVVWRDLRPVLDEEVGRLPEKFRVPFVLCHLEGLTNDEAARRLGCPKGTILSRLARARERLRDRLTRRGIGVPTALFAAALAEDAAAAVPAALVAATVRLGLAFAPGCVAATIPTPATTLAEGVINGMFLTHLKVAAAVLLTLGVLGSGVGLLARGPGGDGPDAGAPQPPAKAPDKNPQPAKVGKAAPPKTVEASRPRVSLDEQAKTWRDELAKPVEFNGIDDPKMTLADVLTQLADQYGLRFEVNEPAFEERGAAAVLDTPVAANRPLPPLKNVSLATALRLVLDRLPLPATYVIRKDTIEVLPVAAVRAELGLENDRPLLPLVWEEVDNVPLPAALKRLAAASGMNVVLDPRALPEKDGSVPVSGQFANVPVDTAVRILANMADLRSVRLDNVLYVTTPKRAAQLLLERKKTPDQEEADAANQPRSPRQFGTPRNAGGM